MASALMILFLGCWLAGQSGVLGDETDSAGSQEMDPTPMEPEGEGGTGPTQPGQTSVTTHLYWGPGKGPAPRQSSTSPLAELKTPAQEDSVYSNIDDGKEMQTLEPDSGAYAELDRQTLQPNVYDTINMSQGAPH